MEQLARVAKVIRDSSIPVLVMQGNHDFRNFGDEVFYRITDFVRPPFVCRAGDVNLIFLDANYNSDGTRYGENGTPIDWKDTCIPSNQLEKLREILAGSSKGSRFWILCHQCLDIGVEERHIVNNADEVLNIIEHEGRGKVEFIICGHYHPGAYSIDFGREFITLPAVCTGKDFNPDAALILDTSHIPNFRG
jgi:3',5'-cyclic AMP phosphodiesterase CpdA